MQSKLWPVSHARDPDLCCSAEATWRQSGIRAAMSIALHATSCSVLQARSRNLPAACILRHKASFRCSSLSRQASRTRCARICTMGDQGASEDASKANQGRNMDQACSSALLYVYSRSCCDPACKVCTGSFTQSSAPSAGWRFERQMGNRYRYV